MNRYEASAPGIGWLGLVLAGTRAEALAKASRRWPYAPHPIALAGLDPEPVPEADPTKTPEAKAKRRATMAANAEARKDREAKMAPGARAWHQKQRKAKAANRWRQYYLAKQGAAE